MELVNISKRCICGKGHYMENTNVKHLCIRCNRIVKFTNSEKQHYIKHEEELSRAKKLA